MKIYKVKNHKELRFIYQYYGNDIRILLDMTNINKDSRIRFYYEEMEYKDKSKNKS